MRQVRVQVQGAVAATLLEEVRAGHASDTPITAPSSTALTAVDGAAEEIHAVLADSAVRCGSFEKWVVVGYSLGAAATRTALGELTAQTAMALAATVLIADPGRDARAPDLLPLVELGSAAGGQGLLSFASELGLVEAAAPLPSQIRENAISLCNLGDPVCDTAAGVPASAFLLSEGADWGLNLETALPISAAYGSESGGSLSQLGLVNVGVGVAARVNGEIERTRTTQDLVGEVSTPASVELALRPELPIDGGNSRWRTGATPAISPTILPILSPNGRLMVVAEAATSTGLVVEMRTDATLWIPIGIDISIFDDGLDVPPVATNLASYPPAPSTQSARQSCAEVLFIGARGSGERANQGGGYGGSIAIARDGLIDSLPSDTRVRELYVDYTAADVFPTVFLPGGTLGNAYLDSVADGVVKLQNALIDSLRRCPDERIVVAGYSQGAWVAQIALADFTSPVSARIASVILLANPGRIASEPMGNQGSASPGSGVGSWATGANALPPLLASRTVQLCDDGDAVCDSTEVLARASALTQVALSALEPGSTDINDIISANTISAATAGLATHTAYDLDYLRLRNLGLGAGAILESVSGISGDNTLDRTHLVAGFEASDSGTVTGTQVITMPDGSAEMYWLLRRNGTDTGADFAIMRSVRPSPSAAWTAAASIYSAPARLSFSIPNVQVTPAGRVVMSWSESVHQGSSYASGPYGDGRLLTLIREPGNVAFGAPVTVRESLYRISEPNTIRVGDGGHVVMTVRSSNTGTPRGSAPADTPSGYYLEAAYLDPGSTGWSDFAIITNTSTVNYGVSVDVRGDGTATIGWADPTDLDVSQLGFTSPSFKSRTLLPGEIEWSDVDRFPLPPTVDEGGYYVAGLSEFTYGGWSSTRGLTGTPDGVLHAATTGSIRFGPQILFLWRKAVDGPWALVDEEVIPNASAEVFTGSDTTAHVINQAGRGNAQFPESSNWGIWNETRQNSGTGEWGLPRSISSQPIDAGRQIDSPILQTRLRDGTLVVVSRHEPIYPASDFVDFRVTTLPPGASTWTRPQTVFQYRLADITVQSIALESVSGSFEGGLDFFVSRYGVSTVQLRSYHLDIDPSPRTLRPVTVDLTISPSTPPRAGSSVVLVPTALFVAERVPTTYAVPGTLEVFDGDDLLGSIEVPTPSGQSGSVSAVVATAGAHDFHARFTPADSADVASGVSAPRSYNVPQASPTLGIVAQSTTFSWGTASQYTLDLASTSLPTGSVELFYRTLSEGYAIARSLGSQTIDEEAPLVFTISEHLPVGTHRLYGVYSGDANNMSTTSLNVVVSVAKAVPSMTWQSPVQVIAGDAESATLFVANGATGDVSVTGLGANAVTFAVQPNGTIVVPLSGLAAGSRTLVATYPGSAQYTDASRSTVIQVTSPVLPPVTGAQPSIVGPARIGELLTADAGTWLPTGLSLSYQWLRAGEPIMLATAVTYQLDAVDLGSTISVRVTGSAVGYQPFSSTSTPTGPVVAGTLNEAVSATLSGAAVAGSVLTITPGAWSPEATSVVYQWFRNDELISGADGGTFLIGTADIGSRISVTVLASRLGYTDWLTTLGPTEVVVPALSPDERVERLAGAGRFETSVLISQATFDPGVPVVYIANGFGFPDALSGAPVAGIEGGPILLVSATEIPQVVLDELVRLQPGRIVILGGRGVVSSVLESSLDAYTAGPVVRLAGAGRFETSVLISQATFDPGVPVVYIANGFGFPDALSGAPVAGIEGGPILLVSATEIPQVVLDELVRLQPGRIVVLGGEGVVSRAVRNQLVALVAE